MNSDSEFIFATMLTRFLTKRFLKTLGYFTKSEKIAFVTTRQRFDAQARL